MNCSSFGACNKIMIVYPYLNELFSSLFSSLLFSSLLFSSLLFSSLLFSSLLFSSLLFSSLLFSSQFSSLLFSTLFSSPFSFLFFSVCNAFALTSGTKGVSIFKFAPKFSEKGFDLTSKAFWKLGKKLKGLYRSLVMKFPDIFMKVWHIS